MQYQESDAERFFNQEYRKSPWSRCLHWKGYQDLIELKTPSSQSEQYDEANEQNAHHSILVPNSSHFTVYRP
jgi:hypothetical protein